MGVEIQTFPYEFFNAGEIKVGLFEQTERHDMPKGLGSMIIPRPVDNSNIIFFVVYFDVGKVL